MSKKRARTYARNRTAISRRGNLKMLAFDETDAVFLLKLILALVIGAFWVRVRSHQTMPGIPIGALVAFGLVRTFEKHPLNRRILYLVVVIIGLISYFLPAGIVLG